VQRKKQDQQKVNWAFHECSALNVYQRVFEGSENRQDFRRLPELCHAESLDDFRNSAWFLIAMLV
jgi:hypothetical protein